MQILFAALPGRDGFSLELELFNTIIVLSAGEATNGSCGFSDWSY